MGENAEYLEIIKQAQIGSRDSMSRLAEDARGRVFVYIYRVTLDYHLAQDLSQETVLEMFKSIKRLKIESVNLFWSWLYRTAMGKVQHNFRNQGSRRIEKRTVFSDWELLKNIPKDNKSGLEMLLRKELSQAILKTMGQMKMAYRNVLTLRCFDEMSYAEIAAATGGSEMQARLQFFRAKQMLRKQLVQNGFEREHLLPALGLFGTITGFSAKTASAATTISSAATKVGVTASVIGTAISKTGVITFAIVIITSMAAIKTVKVFENAAATNRGSDVKISTMIHSGAFENPSSLVRAYPGGGDWQAADYLKQQQQAISVDPEELLVGPRKPSNFYVIFPKGYWMELGFSGEIVDGRGIDICIDGRATGKPPLVFITDGAGQEVQVTLNPTYQNYMGSYRLTAFDISGLTLPFKPRALRIVGADNEGPWGGAEIWAVYARVAR